MSGAASTFDALVETSSLDPKNDDFGTPTGLTRNG